MLNWWLHSCKGLKNNKACADDAIRNDFIKLSEAVLSRFMLDCSILFSILVMSQKSGPRASSQQAYNLENTSCQRRCDVITSHRHWFDVVLSAGIVPIFKKNGSMENPDTYRGITILSCMGKLFTSNVNTHI